DRIPLARSDCRLESPHRARGFRLQPGLGRARRAHGPARAFAHRARRLLVGRRRVSFVASVATLRDRGGLLGYRWCEMGKPSYDDATLEAYFQPLHAATYADPILAPLLRRLTSDDQDLIAAVADVDRSQIREALARSPEERLRRSFGIAATLKSMRRVA